MPVLSSHDPEKKFLYFAFGSNLLRERLHLSCPSATRLSPGRLFGYRLTFNYNSLRWRGHVATIREGDHDSLWGCIWIIDNEELEALHRQEGVHQGLYRPLSVDVTTPEGMTLPVLTYQMTLPYEDNPLPSCVYKKVMLHGARESSLPAEYIENMKALPDNGYDGPVEVQCSLLYRQDTAEPQSHMKVNHVQMAEGALGPQNEPVNAVELTVSVS
ncbi:gamma-glutamylcyclotransferase-like [Paramacrobiotus metropolitanus]|uniref:gamma-glutamylcyclotransferase-like n=1 Tax=Paramacrobiotus metropolitanus TaxID=2943436 RepID=UPI002445A583|nr:gamma-glutamylcyclotransferase-like [Paramacrobiotus metropolitanus]